MNADLNALKREARKKTTTPQRRLELAAQDVQLSRAVASGKYTPLNVLEKLARSSDAGTRQRVAANPLTPAPLLEVLAADKAAAVAKAVITNPNMTQALWERLAVHPKEVVRFAILVTYGGLPPMPESVQRLFLASKREKDRAKLADYPHLVPALALKLKAESSTEIMSNLLYAHPHLYSQAELEGLASHEDVGVRTRVAALLHNTELLTALTKDPDWGVRFCAVSNHATPPEALEELAYHLLGLTEWDFNVGGRLFRRLQGDRRLSVDLRQQLHVKEAALWAQVQI